MTRRRLGTPAFTTGTRGRSLLNRWTYGGRSSSPVDDLYYPELYRPHFTTFYDTTGEENDIRKSVNRELSFSAHAVDDGYDIASKSRNRDAHLLREANKALVDTEIHGSPRIAMVSRRARSVSVAPSSSPKTIPPHKTSYQRYRNEVDYMYGLRPASAWDSDFSYKAAMADWCRGYMGYPHNYQDGNYRYHRHYGYPHSAWYSRYADYPYGARLPYSNVVQSGMPLREKSHVVHTALGPRVLPHAWPYSSPFLDRYYESKRHVPVRFLANPLHYKNRYRQAAIVGNKVDVVLPSRHRPKSEYAASKIRRIKKEQREQTSPPEDTTGLSASKPSFQGHRRRRYEFVIC